MTRQLGNSQIPNIVEVKIEVAKIKKMVNELYKRPFIPSTMIIEIEPKIEVENI